MTCAREPQNWGLGTDVCCSLLNHEQLEGFLQAPVQSTGNPPVCDPPPVSVRDSWSVEQAILCFSIKQEVRNP